MDRTLARRIDDAIARLVEGDAPQEVTGSFTGWLHWTVEDEITLTVDQ